MRRVLVYLPFYLMAMSLAHAQDLTSEVKNLTFVGFQQYLEASRVFIQTNEQVNFRVDDSRRDTVTVVLENTGVTAVNHLNHLDTRFYDSPVRFIQPQLIEGTSPSVHVEISLRNRVPYETTQTDNVIAIDFKLP